MKMNNYLTLPLIRHSFDFFINRKLKITGMKKIIVLIALIGLSLSQVWSQEKEDRNFRIPLNRRESAFIRS